MLCGLKINIVSIFLKQLIIDSCQLQITLFVKKISDRVYLEMIMYKIWVSIIIYTHNND